MSDPRETELFLFMQRDEKGAPVGIEHALRGVAFGYAPAPSFVPTACVGSAPVDLPAPVLSAFTSRAQADQELVRLQPLSPNFEQLHVVRVLARIAPEEYPAQSTLWLLGFDNARERFTGKIDAIKVVRQMLNLGLKEAKELVERAPCEIGVVDKAWAPELEEMTGRLGVRWEWR